MNRVLDKKDLVSNIGSNWTVEDLNKVLPYKDFRCTIYKNVDNNWVLFEVDYTDDKTRLPGRELFVHDLGTKEQVHNAILDEDVWIYEWTTVNDVKNVSAVLWENMKK